MITGAALVFPSSPGNRLLPQLGVASEQAGALTVGSQVTLTLVSGQLHQHGRLVGTLEGGISGEDQLALRQAGSAVLVSVADGGLLKGTWAVVFK